MVKLVTEEVNFFILTMRVKLNNKSKLKGIFDPLLKKGQK